MPRVAEVPQSGGERVGASPSNERQHYAERGDYPETGVVKSDGWWEHNELDAYRTAASSQRGVLVDVSAVWCVPCVLMDRDVFSDPMVRARIASSFVPLRIDVSEETRANREQLQRYRIKRLPAVLLLDASGRVLDRIESYVDATDMQRRVARAAQRLVRLEVPGPSSSSLNAR